MCVCGGICCRATPLRYYGHVASAIINSREMSYITMWGGRKWMCLYVSGTFPQRGWAQNQYVIVSFSHVTLGSTQYNSMKFSMSFHVSDSTSCWQLFLISNWHHVASLKQGPQWVESILNPPTLIVLGVAPWRKTIHCWSVHHPCNIDQDSFGGNSHKMDQNDGLVRAYTHQKIKVASCTLAIGVSLIY